MTDQFDSPWKEALEEYFEEGMAFFFPQIHADIDWSQGYEFLDKELEKVVRQAVVTEQAVDKLVQVYHKSGQDTWVMIHLDVQSQHDKNFTKRMYQYNYRLFDRYDRSIVTLVIFGDDSTHWQPHQFERELWGCKLAFEFPRVKLNGYNITELEQSPNPFAVVVLAHLYTKTTHHAPTNRYDLKWRLTRMLYERGYDKAKILSLYRYIDWLMALPPELEQKLDQEVITYEEAQKMPYITSAERFGYERGRKAGLEEAREIWLQQGLQEGKQQGLQEGLQQGLQQGLKQGLQQGKQQGLQQGLQEGLQQGLQEGELQLARESIVEILQIRFGELPPLLVSSIKFLPHLPLLKHLLKKAAIIPSRAEFEAELAEQLKPLLK